MSTERELKKLLKRPVAEVARAIDAESPLLEGLLWAPVRLEPPPRHADSDRDAYRRFVERYRLLEAENRLVSLSFHPVLSSWAPTPFVLDGLHAASVEALYHALKFPEGSNERIRVAGGEMWKGPLRRWILRARGTSFTYGGRELAIGSPDHATLVARAIESKIRQNGRVLDALIATGAARIVLNPRRLRGSRNLLGAITPFVLMLLRWQMQQRA